MHLVDPGPLIEERLRTEVEPLRAALALAIDAKERKTLKRQIRHQRREIRLLRLHIVAW